MQLSGYRALVCGASRGIGRAAANAMASAGADVILLARDRAGLEQASLSLPRPDSHQILALDLSDSDTVRARMAEWVATQPTVHILVNNAGGPPPGPLLAAQQHDLQAAFMTHVLSSQALVQALVPGMKAAGYGRIINVISTSVREPIRNLGVSNTIRAAMAGWSKTLSRELAPHGITVNNILPGSTLTDRHRSLIESRARQANIDTATIERQMLADIPMGRFAAPEEVAAAIGFLASPSAGYITGVNLPVDGGRISAI
jgi:3-oxoacyl-[acyl-carrier protein] reductase